jgi:DNA-binding CsgD family transcriptional regulator
VGNFAEHLWGDSQSLITGIFGILVWVFAVVSAYAQYTHGLAERDAGRAQDAWWAMPAFALLGPLLLEVTLHRLRRWLRQDAEEILTGAAGFGVRWLVAPFSTLSAWASSRREGIASAPAALRFVAERKTVKALGPVEAMLYAFGATATRDPHTARVWLAARGVRVRQAAIDAALVAADAGRGADAPCAPVIEPVEPADAAVVVPASTAAAGGPSRVSTSKRQPSAAERVARAVARTPQATDASIAARLGLSEATVRRHRRQAVDSVSTDAAAQSAAASDHTVAADDSTELELAHV